MVTEGPRCWERKFFLYKGFEKSETLFPWSESHFDSWLAYWLDSRQSSHTNLKCSALRKNMKDTENDDIVTNMNFSPGSLLIELCWKELKAYGFVYCVSFCHILYYIMFYFYFILFYWWTKQQSYLCHIFNYIVQYNFPLLYRLRYWTSRIGQGTCFFCTYNIPGTVLTPATNQNWSRFLSWVAINSWKQIVLNLKLNEP